MAYKLIVSPRAVHEVGNAIEFYAKHSVDAPINFLTALQNAYTRLETNPFLRIRYKDVRALKIKKFPYLLYFVVNEHKNIISVLSCFGSRQNPNKRPRFSKPK
jgi:toxin ParE1/3/4